MKWEEDKRWSDKFLPEVKMILGLHLIGEPPIEEDSERNTDLIVLKMEPVRIACRIRRFEYFEKYKDEITFRCERPNGNRTELSKIIEGWGDYFFYGFSDKEELNLCFWKICKLNAFRIWFNRELYKGNRPGIEKANGDGSSKFIALETSIIPNFIMAEKEIIPF